MESILFFIKRKKLLKDGTAPIYIRITINKITTEFSSGKSVIPSQWITTKGRVKGNNLLNKQLNSYLEQQEYTIREIIIAFKQEGKQVSAQDVSRRYKGEDEKSTTFLALYEEHNTQLEQLIGKSVAKATYKRHCTSKKLFEEFLTTECKKKDILIREITSNLLERYKIYLMTVRNNNNNTTVKYLRNVGKILHLAMLQGIISASPLEHLTLKVENVEKEFLTAEELARLANKQFEIQRLEQVRDVFLFCCFTGLAYVDVNSLTSKDIVKDANGQYWIMKNRCKTNTACNIPLLNPALRLLEKYYQVSMVSGKLLPVLSNQKMNAYLKEIANICNISKPLSTHVARHTFATTVTLANNVSIENVSKMLGHKNIRMTQHYAKILNESIAKEMANVDTKMNSIAS